ncbi:hypothetical protein Pla108_02030 [Botrimarina colliarenosi]|uniref:Uncharacterized protein n=1 Tax=Botrimarina colliarenosi TaxID=2528001 RepID=A0A5C6AJ47_9BACT|nr:hypothetical protein [Botrimarina colliarenosi]TWT99268.1 hypothetical protein Pla108_02030 [Botrimarina colliarenosi]
MPQDPLPPLSPLKTDPKYGYYPWWPEDGDDWVHPGDVATARSMIPSPRVWRRDGERGGYVVLHYGDTAIRVRRTLWREAPYEGIDLGDWVEVRSRGMTNEPHVGHVRDMHWDEHAGVVRYWLTLGDDTPLERSYEAHDLKPIEPATPREEVRREPRFDGSEDLDILEP